MFARRRFFLSFYRRTEIKFSFLFICFILQLHSVFASPNDPWQLLDIVGTAGLPAQNNVKGFECGNDFFSDSEINEALSMYYHYQMDQNYQNIHNALADPATPVNPNVQQHPYNSNNPNNPQEIDDFNIDQFLNLEDFDFPIEGYSPRENLYAQQHLTPTIYQGPLYIDSRSFHYILWPIQKENMMPSSSKYSAEPYYIVIKKNNGEFIDVISRIKNNYHTRCIRIDGSMTESSSLSPEMNKGYKCAHEVLSDDMIQKSLSLVLDNFGKSNKYPASFVGRIYPPNSGYMIWPILSRDGLYDYNSVEVGPYFLVIDTLGNLIGVVVEGLSGNFLRCPRSGRPSKMPVFDLPNQLSEPELEHESEPETVSKSKSGYFCGRNFFSDKKIMEAARAAWIAHRAKPTWKLPSKFNGPPFNEPVLLWPLMLNGRTYEKGSMGIYRVVLTKTFKVKAIAIIQNRNIRLCDKSVMEEEKDHDKNDYYCYDHLVTNSQLVDAAEKACSSFLKRRYKFYPAIYGGPNFEKAGPYYTYPVLRRRKFVTRPGKDRVVINSKCEVVGAFTTISERYTRGQGPKNVLCIKNQESPFKTFIEPHVAITEHSRKGRY